MRNVDPARPWYGYARRVLPPASSGVSVELGSGQGEFLADGYEGRLKVGVDLSLDNAAASRDACGRGLVADLEHALPFASGSVDGVVMIEVIEHIVSAESLVDEIARVLRPGGWLVLTTPNVAHLTYRLRALTGHPPKQEGYHFRFFTKALLESLLTERGFQVEASASFGKQAFLTKVRRLLPGGDRRHKVRYRVWPRLEALLAQHFVWRLRLEPSEVPATETVSELPPHRSHSRIAPGLR